MHDTSYHHNGGYDYFVVVYTDSLEHARVYNRIIFRTSRAKATDILYPCPSQLLIPLITNIGLTMGYLMGGEVVENCFSILGLAFASSITQRDYPFLQAILLIFGDNV